MKQRRRKGTGTIEKVVDPDGTIRHRARVPRADGTREDLGIYPTYEAADLAIASARKRTATMLKQTGVLVRDWGSRFLEQRELARLRGMRQEKSRWKVLIDGSPIADLPMAGVQRADAKAWVRWLCKRRIKMKNPKHPANGKQMQRQGMQNALNLVRKAFEEAQDELGLTGNPFAGVKLPKDEGRTHEPWTYLMPDEQHRLLEALSARPRAWAIVAFSLFTGMRQAEVYSLRWEDVTSLGVTVRYGAQGKATKSGKIRRIPLIGLAQDALDAQRGKRQQPHGLVFPNRLGNRRFSGEPSWWKRALELAELSDGGKRHDGRTVRWHDLRHTCGSSLIAGWWGRQWQLREVQALMGHASITTTERYAHLAGSVLELAAKETKYTPTLLSGTKKLKELGP